MFEKSGGPQQKTTFKTASTPSTKSTPSTSSTPSTPQQKPKNSLLFKHGGYRKLKTFQLAQLIYDITNRFCNKFINVKSRTHDQMVQSARSGVQNIAEGSQFAGTSKKFEIKLTNTARSSLEELRLDYEDFLRQRKLAIWPYNDMRRQQLINMRVATADQFLKWVTTVATTRNLDEISEVGANGVLVLINVCCALLDRQLDAQAKAFQTEGGFTERLYKTRTSTRQK